MSYLAWILLAVVVLGVLMFLASRSGEGISPEAEIPILLFSEGKNYNSTFRPMVDAFLANNTPIVYATCDKNDPILSLKHEHLQTLFLGKGHLGYARLRFMRAQVMISTTPNISAPGFPLVRPKGVKNLVHVCHAVAGLGNYNKFSLDAYDTVLMPGDFMLEEVRKIERLRNLPEKTCLSAGLPYLDTMAQRAQRKTGISSPPVILVAPSWGTKNFLKYMKSDFLHAIAAAGCEVILRPHPQSWVSEAPFFEALAAELSSYKNVTIDREVDGSASMRKADILISGRSAVRFDFAFLYEKPVISVSIPFPANHEYEFADLGRTWEDDAEHHLGPVIDPSTSADEMRRVIEKALTFAPSDIARLRAESVVNFGAAAPAIAALVPATFLRKPQ